MTADAIVEVMVYYCGKRARSGWMRCGNAYLHTCSSGRLPVLAERYNRGWKCPNCGDYRVDVGVQRKSRVRVYSSP
jgi:predicted RNA-binding Zn-ribbon protein involved in translation (DUF1610 family)